jgi:hypothetical protein
LHVRSLLKLTREPVAQGLLPAPRVDGADSSTRAALSAHGLPLCEQEPQGCGGEAQQGCGGEAALTSMMHADTAPAHLLSFGLAVKGVDLPTQIAQNTPLRCTVSLVRTCEFAPTRVALHVTGIAPSRGLCGTMSGLWINGTHQGVPGVEHGAEEGLVIFAVHDDGHTKMAAWRRLPGAPADVLEHVEGRACVGSLLNIDAASLSRTWDEASSTGIAHAHYAVNDIKIVEGERRHCRSQVVNMGAVGHEVALNCLVSTGLPEAGVPKEREGSLRGSGREGGSETLGK